MSGADIAVRDEKGVTAQEERLLLNVLAGLTFSAAAAAAGYEFRDMKRGAQRVLRREPVKTRLTALRVEAQKRAEITQDDVVTGFKDAIADAKMLSDPTAQIAGWREIAKVLGFYAAEVRKVEISVTERRARQELSELSEEDLLKIIADDGAIEGEFNVLDS